MSRFIQKYSLALYPSSTNSTADTDLSIFITVHALFLELGRFPVPGGGGVGGVGGECL